MFLALFKHFDSPQEYKKKLLLPPELRIAVLMKAVVEVEEYCWSGKMPPPKTSTAPGRLLSAKTV